ncbi:MAG: PrsW family intramembrane metalloprotease [Leptospiraceae bacterium]|nr:PrsW family intramembrane metalloprotease [Leptospiraceae bacterium]MCB1321049.1 PrsW family intramembrane metalloprotease [Leptospiraceae bacterium]
MLAYVCLYVAVSVFWLLLFSGYRRHLKPGTIWRVFLIGLLAGPPAGLLSAWLQSLLDIPSDALLQKFLLYFFIVGPVEELAKFAAVFLAAIKRLDFRSSSDGIVLAVTAALGFAMGENVLYLLSFGLEATLPRLILGNLGHAAYALCWGYGLGVVFHEDAPFSILLGGLGLATILHGTYNFLITWNAISAIVALLLSGVLFLLLFWLTHTESRRT